MTLEPFADITTEQYTYDLPEERIALFPADNRDDSRLLIRKKDGTLGQDSFRNLSRHLRPGSSIFMNNSKVIPARLLFTKDTGSRIEVFCLNPTEPSDYARSLSATSTCVWECMVGNMKRFNKGSLLMFPEINGTRVILRAEKLSQNGNIAEVRFSWEPDTINFAAILSEIGKTPLPPYIKREAMELDRERYQTVYSKHNGSVAAPTAGLHFTASVFEQLRRKKITSHELTLHVGAGTFQPIKSSRVLDHEMHAEVFTVRRDLIRILADADSRVTCVGTTSVRTLESLYWLGVKIIQTGGPADGNLQIEQWEPYYLPQKYSMKQSFEAFGEWMEQRREKELAGSTRLMIVPGYEFRAVDTLITNFHQPRSTLLLLIAAFIGESWKDTYHYALQNGFRFLSYGDSSLLFR